MRKESQRELINEGFADIARSVAVAAKNIDPQISSALDTLYQPIGAVKTAFERQNPKSKLMAALKSEYYRTFDFKSVKLGKEQKLPDDDKGDNRVAIPFSARLIKAPSRNTSTTTNVSGGSTTTSVSGGPVTTSTIRGGKEPQEQFTAVLSRTKKGLSGEYKLDIIRDKSGNAISPDIKRTSQSSDKILLKTWKSIVNQFQSEKSSAVRAITADRVIELIAINTGYDVQKLKQISKNGKTLTDIIQTDLNSNNADLAETYKFLKSQFLVESYKKTQLQLLESSYNLIYELPINKGN